MLKCFYPDDGGFSRELFVTEPFSDFDCCICLGVANDPQICQNGHLFCKACIITNIRLKNTECPMQCDAVLTEQKLISNRQVKNIVDSLKVFCCCNGSGQDECGWTGPLHELRTRECRQIYIACANEGCDESFIWPDMLQHSTKDCSKRPVSCRYCYNDIPLDSQTAHELVCECRPHKCECKMTVPYHKLSEHKATKCVLAEVVCPLYSVNLCASDNCTGKCLRKHLRKHLLDQGDGIVDTVSALCESIAELRRNNNNFNSTEVQQGSNDTSPPTAGPVAGSLLTETPNVFMLSSLPTVAPRRKVLAPSETNCASREEPPVKRARTTESSTATASEPLPENRDSPAVTVCESHTVGAMGAHVPSTCLLTSDPFSSSAFPSTSSSSSSSSSGEDAHPVAKTELPGMQPAVSAAVFVSSSASVGVKSQRTAAVFEITSDGESDDNTPRGVPTVESGVGLDTAVAHDSIGVHKPVVASSSATHVALQQARQSQQQPPRPPPPPQPPLPPTPPPLGVMSTVSGGLKTKHYAKCVYEGSLDASCQKHGYGTLRWFKGVNKGNVYTGHFFRDSRHGQGKQLFANGDVFEGEWRLNAQYDGTMRYSGGDMYVGRWEKNKPHGHGKMYFAQPNVDNSGVYNGQASDDSFIGDIYCGEWSDQLQHGSGVMRYRDKSVYFGQWVAGKYHGKGVFRQSDGSKYDGMWYEGLRHGIGEQIIGSGDRLQVNWVSGGIEEGAFGTQTLSNGVVYIGQFSADGERHGRGRMQLLDGSTQEGLWVRDVFCEEAGDDSQDSDLVSEDDTSVVVEVADNVTTTAASTATATAITTAAATVASGGNNEFGTVLATADSGHNSRAAGSVQDGVGTISYLNGDSYAGSISGGLRHGEGALVCAADGSQYEGSWVRDVKHGPGRFTKANGDCVHSHWIGGVMNTNGAVRYANGDVYTGPMDASGRRDGAGGVLTLADGTIKSGRWARDLLHGYATVTNPGGTLQYEGDWTNGHKHYCGTMYDRGVKGNVYTGGIWLDQEHGRGVLTRAVSGRRIYDGLWRHGVKHGYGIYMHANGDEYRGRFFSDKRHDPDGILYMSNGDVYRGAFVNGDMHGRGRLTTANGMVTVGTWCEGVMLRLI